MLQLEVFILKLIAVDGFPASAVTPGKISTLYIYIYIFTGDTLGNEMKQALFPRATRAKVGSENKPGT